MAISMAKTFALKHGYRVDGNQVTRAPWAWTRAAGSEAQDVLPPDGTAWLLDLRIYVSFCRSKDLQK